ncbi:hypothetical protein [Patulibacter sp. SYSU D01012]|uniref:hypothetical protein n=1 Tax=Patulibacter sp. SYSU D01012 TaxID=2817381 RepID=UPI001B30E84F|nr:hypothetical protein [Patulibacter sp. SYSU D01012]
MPFLPGSQPPGARVVTVDGPEGRRGKPGTPGTPGDPALLFKGLPVGEAVGVDADGNPVSLGPVVTGGVREADELPRGEGVEFVLDRNGALDTILINGKEA